MAIAISRRDLVRAGSGSAFIERSSGKGEAPRAASVTPPAAAIITTTSATVTIQS